jgi:hypothetical protein
MLYAPTRHRRLPERSSPRADIAHQLGFSEIDFKSSSTSAQKWLDQGLQGEAPLPDAIVLNRDLGYESGYELLRF